jgi:predicted phage tail protein
MIPPTAKKARRKSHTMVVVTFEAVDEGCRRMIHWRVTIIVGVKMNQTAMKAMEPERLMKGCMIGIARESHGWKADSWLYHHRGGAFMRQRWDTNVVGRYTAPG